MLLIEEDVAAGDRRLVEVPDERLLLERQRREAVRVQLHDRRIVDALEQVLAIVGRLGRRALRRRCGRGSFLRRLSSAARRNCERGQPSRYTFRRHRSVTIYLDSVFVRRVAVAQPFRAARRPFVVAAFVVSGLSRTLRRLRSAHEADRVVSSPNSPAKSIVPAAPSNRCRPGNTTGSRTRSRCSSATWPTWSRRSRRGSRWK